MCTPVSVVIPTLDARPFLVVCAWHTDRAELLALAREFPGQVSHSMCPACVARFEQGATS